MDGIVIYVDGKNTKAGINKTVVIFIVICLATTIVFFYMFTGYRDDTIDECERCLQQRCALRYSQVNYTPYIEDTNYILEYNH